MEFKKKIYTIGDTRIRRGFMFFPKTVRGQSYTITKWLEHAIWEETYMARARCPGVWVATQWGSKCTK